MGNRGWLEIGKRLLAESDFEFFEEHFCAWEREAILLTEITYADTYTYVTPMGVFTDIGTLARALQRAIEPGWGTHVSLIGTDLHIVTDKQIADSRHELICKFVELDQANSGRHCDGWKLERNIDYSSLMEALECG